MPARLLATLALLVACGGRAVADDTAGRGSSSADPTSSGGGMLDSTGAADPICTCVDLELVCFDPEGTALASCDLPTPCGVLDETNAQTECVRQLLITQEPSRFRYFFENVVDGGFEIQTWTGSFYVLGPGEGHDQECYERTADLSGETVPAASAYEIEPPEYFEACPADGSDEARSCILAGLEMGDPVPECTPE